MDAPEEDLDIKLQKISGDLISDFDRSLRPFLRKKDGAGGTLVRSRVRSRETDRLISSLLDPFQEVPQLLDPHLPKWLPVLADVFLEYQQTRRRSRVLSTRSELLMPLPTAICKILYTLCKIRGEKVIVRFLSNEARYLELLLSALEEFEHSPGPLPPPPPPPSETGTETGTGTGTGTTTAPWTWEERYVVLLWLSHLMLAPFDLASISSVEVEDDELPFIPGFRWPAKLPGITARILPLAIKYLASPGKERDAAKALLVRISMRKDMQQLGVLDALVQWALVALRPKRDTTEKTPYHYIGILSFLAGILVSSSNTSDMDRHLMRIFYAVHGASTEENAPGSMLASALARKTMIKVIRAITVLVLRSPVQDMAATELVETTIGFLLENLADNDTPVRLAASKALSIIALKLDADMASQVVEAVLESLNRNVLWVKNPRDPTAAPTKDLSAVNPLEWHGLILTLSHLLYRRSPPAENLSDIIHTLLMGLSFERRSTSGGSIGTNVRDAACFGIWALARRYSTKELLAVPAASSLATASRNPQASILQIIATELIVAASLDPSGNIRRGSSAALQELIGRHPDTVEKGIWLVQAADYHAVALRSRALQEVALGATKLSGQYGEAILDALLGWRGIGDADVGSRRAAGLSFGTITVQLASSSPDPVQRLARSVALVLDHLKILQARQVEERHGLLLCLASVFNSLPGMSVADASVVSTTTQGLDEFVQNSIGALLDILGDCESRAYRRPELIAEAAGRLVVSSFPLLQAATSGFDGKSPNHLQASLLPGPVLMSQSSVEISKLAEALGPRPKVAERVVDLVESNLRLWLARTEDEVITAASEAGLVLLMFCDKAKREEVIRGWADNVRQRPSGRSSTAGYFSALAKSYLIISTLELRDEDEALICNAFLDRWRADGNTETRVAILQSLIQSDMLKQNTDLFLPLISEALDDYTTNARGDVGSHVRLQAIRATKWLWETLDQRGLDDRLLVIDGLFLRILRLAAEKLDRVRVEAQAALALALNPVQASKLRQLTFSSKIYFCFLLDLISQDWLDPAISGKAQANADRWMEELMAGFVSSADTGNEELVIAARAAVCDFCERSQANADAVCTALVRNLKTHQGQDRVLVPTLEVLAFLFQVGVVAQCSDVIDYKDMCLLVQKAGYKTGNVRKIEACIKVYGAIAALGQQPKTRDARKRLGALMYHPWPRVRSLVVDQLWGLTADDEGRDENTAAAAAARLMGVDWGRAEKGAVKSLVEDLELA
ncbi:tubulin folding cofactor D C terminal-domain-containing protein [Podospora appendiculata]|uniref:Tubulin folding cofactor D C terminal-domain-containing protein n=1 Tax=Podospora appendiculata TaxID=314037 RepID=A0AAE0X8J6_9PEZI|nr:tubulin folding cofactor D C terminal-domain-containing protein [Podospora appendiculata]